MKPTLILILILTTTATLGPRLAHSQLCDTPLAPLPVVVSSSSDSVSAALVMDVDAALDVPISEYAPVGIKFNDIVVVQHHETGIVEWYMNTGAGVGWTRLADNSVIDADVSYPRWLTPLLPSVASPLSLGNNSFAMCEAHPSASSVPDTCAVYFGDAVGAFDKVVLDASLRSVAAMLSHDLNEDNHKDIVALEVPRHAVSPGNDDFNLLAWVDSGIGAGYAASSALLLSSASTPAFNHSGVIAFGDIDAAGAPDVVWATWNANAGSGGESGLVAFAPSTGSLSFGPAVVIDEDLVLAKSTGLVVADFDGDRDDDVCVATESGSLRWYENAGPGTGVLWTSRSLPFQQPVNYMTVHDVDKDGDLDLVFASRVSGLAFWVSNLYDGGSATPPRSRDDLWGILRTVASCGGCSDVTVGDVDTDTDPDMIMAAPAENMVSVILNNPFDVFQYRFIAVSIAKPKTMIHFDMDGDGDSDAFSTLESGELIAMENLDFFGDEWSLPVYLGAPAVDLADPVAVDIDLDGDIDIITAARDPLHPAVLITLNDGSGSFSQGSWDIVIPDIVAHVTRTVDWDLDGDLDLVVATDNSTLVTITNLRVENGALAFAAPVIYSADYLDIRDVHFADLNADGFLDLVFSDRATSAFHWGPNVDGSLSSATLLYTAMSHVGRFVVASMTFDSTLDILYHRDLPPGPESAAESALYFAFNSGSLTAPLFFTGAPLAGILEGPTDQNSSVLAFTDFDGDGIKDIIVEGSFNSILLYFPGPTFIPTPITVTNREEHIIFVPADLNQDSAPDFFLSYTSQMGWLPGVTMFKPQFPIPPSSTEVDTIQCGFTVSCITRAIVDSNICAETKVHLSPGVYHGCFATSLFKLNKPIHIVGHGATIACDHSGGLFDIRPGASLTLEDLTIDAPIALPGDPDAPAAIRVSGAGASLVLDRVTISRASSIPQSNPVFQVNQGMGGAILVELGASLSATDSSFVANSAAASGGAIAVSSADATISLTDVSFRDNVALDSGGALYIATQGVQAHMSVILESVVFERNRAVAGSGGAVAFVSLTDDASLSVDVRTSLEMTSNTAEAGGGGAIAVVGPGVSLTAVAAISLSTNTAAWGGALASAFSMAPFTGPDSAAALPQVSFAPLDPPASASLVLAGGPVILQANRATKGGALFLCGPSLILNAPTQVEANRAAHGGGGVFVCLPSGTLPLPSPSALPPRLELDAAPGIAVLDPPGSSLSALLVDATVDAGWGPLVASPPVSLKWTGLDPGSPMALSRASGLALGSELDVTLLDLFGQPVWDQAQRLTLTYAPDAAAAVLSGTSLTGGDRSHLMGGTSVSFTAVKVVVSDKPTLDAMTASSATVDLVVSVEDSDVIGDVALALTLTECGAGEGILSAVGFPIECGPCSEGTYSDTVSLDRCDPCPPGDYTVGDGAASCLTCPANAFRDLYHNLEPENRNTTDGKCVCLPSFFPSVAGIVNVPCLPCPTGASCTGGTSRPAALPGYFPTAGGNMLTCPLRSACAGGEPFRCSGGHSGFLCLVCASGYYTDETGECVKCSGAVDVLFALFVLVLLGVAVAAGVIVAVMSSPKSNANGAAAASPEQLNTASLAARRSRSPVAVSVLLLFCQIVGLLGSSEAFSWPSAAASFLRVGMVFNLNVSLFLNECSLVSFWGKYVVSVIGPVVLAAVFVASAWGVSTVRGSSLAVAALARSCLVSVTPLFYLPLARFALLYWDCTRRPDGVWYLDADPRVQCFTGTWWAMLPFGAAATALYVVSIPAACAALLWSRSHSLFEPDTLARIGALYRVYRRPFWWFELVQMARKLAVVAVALFFSNVHGIQFFLFFVVFFGGVGAFAQLRPYFLPLHNALETRVNAALTAILMLGVAFTGDVFDAWQDTLFTLILFAVVAGAFVYIIWTAVHELRASDAELPVRDAVFWDYVAKDMDDWEDRGLVDLIQSRRP